jgi:hypothetical protein
MGSNDKFRLTTLIFCLVIFLLVTFAHILALEVQSETNIMNIQTELDKAIPDSVRTELENNLRNQTKIDALTILGSFGAIALGVDMPMPFPILVTCFNMILLVAIGYTISSIIRSWVPFVSG